MRLRARNRNSEALPSSVQEERRAKKRAAEKGGAEKHENGESTRGPETSKGHAGFCGENRKV